MIKILSIIFVAQISLVGNTEACVWRSPVVQKKIWLSSKTVKRACKYQPTIEKQARIHDLDPDILNALIYTESGWQPWIVSSANACGLTQVIPKWTGSEASGRRKWTCEQLKKPWIAIPVGARILRWWVDHHTRKIETRRPKAKNKKAIALREALCGYNAGFRGCKRAGNRYAKKVLRIRELLKRARVADTPSKTAPKEKTNSIRVDN